MIAHALIAGATALTLATGAGSEPTMAPAGGAEAKAAASSRKEVTDHAGYKLTLDLDDAGKVVKSAALDPKGKSLTVIPIAMKNMKVCIPRAAKPRCQPLAFVSDGAFFKMGTASCTCYVYNGQPYCYGDTCH